MKRYYKIKYNDKVYHLWIYDDGITVARYNNNYMMLRDFNELIAAIGKVMIIVKEDEPINHFLDEIEELIRHGEIIEEVVKQ